METKNIYIYMGEKVISFETNDTILNYSSELGFNDNKFPYAYGGENIYFMVHRKNIPIQECKTATLKNEYQYLFEKGDENKGVVEYSKNFEECEIIIDKNSN